MLNRNLEVLSKTLLIIGVVTAIAMFPHTWVHAQKASSPGMEPYTPTKLEWLALECGVGLASGSELETRSVDVVATMKEPDTIVILVVYTPNVDRKYMNMKIDGARLIINQTVANHGWGDWVKIKEEFKEVNSTKDRK
jgi:hypothetical protein